MWPTLFTLGDANARIPVHTWGVTITLAFLVAALVTQNRARAGGVDGDRLGGFYLVAFLCGLAGARLLHFTMAEPSTFFRNPLVFFKFWEGGFAFYGGVILAVLGSILYARACRMDWFKLADLTSPTVMLGLSIGRLGCFSAGCCHGRTCDLPADAFSLLPDGFSGGALYLVSHQPFLVALVHGGVGVHDVPFYPTQLWESFWAFLLFLVLSLRWKYRRFDGQVFAWLMLLYPILRSTIEHFRGDTVRGVGWFGLFSTSQLVSIPAFAVGLLVLVLNRRRGVAAVAVRSDDEDLLEDIRGER